MTPTIDRQLKPSINSRTIASWCGFLVFVVHKVTAQMAGTIAKWIKLMMEGAPNVARMRGKKTVAKAISRSVDDLNVPTGFVEAIPVSVIRL